MSKHYQRLEDVMRVGFIGVGNIGQPMAEQILAAGFPLVVHDLRRDAAAHLIDRGAVWAESPAEVAAACDVVCTCLPGPDDVEAVVLGDGGIAERLSPGSIYIDHTTSSPALAKRLYAILKEKGVDMLDAPVSGGMEGARSRDLVMLAGGDRATFDKVRPVLDAMAKTVAHVGSIGAGCICKLAHNAATFAVNLAMVECLTLGVKAGVAPATMVEVFQKCAIGRSFDLQVRLPATLFEGDFDPRVALEIAHKDATLAQELSLAYDVPMRVAEICREEMSEAMSRGWGKRDS